MEGWGQGTLEERKEDCDVSPGHRLCEAVIRRFSEAGL